jgi:hypothetical protein
VRKLLAILACALAISAQAQVPTILMPNPLGIILTVGQWLLQSGKPTIYYIEVAGDGATPEEARMNGFRLAVEQAIGSLIASETVVQNNRIQRDEIISYAAGYVDRFEIVGTQETNHGVRVIMKVWVGRSSLSNRLLAQSQTLGEIQGDRVAVAVATLQQERATGDRLLATVLNDFPRRSFVITTDPSSVQFDSNRRGVVQIPFELKWDSNYLSSLWEALAQTAQGHGSTTVTVVYKPEGNWLRYEGGNAVFADDVKPAMVWQRLARSEPRLLVDILDSYGRSLQKQCFLIPELDQYYQYSQPKNYMVKSVNRGIKIDGAITSKGLAQMPMGPNTNRAQQAQLTVVLQQDCPKN